MPKKQNTSKTAGPATRVVNEVVFKQVYDSPHSLPGKEKWVTTDVNVRAIERLLGIPQKTIGRSVMGKRIPDIVQNASEKRIGWTFYLPP